MEDLLGFEIISIPKKVNDNLPRLVLSDGGISVTNFPNMENVDAVQLAINNATNMLAVLPAKKDDPNVICRQKNGKLPNRYYSANKYVCFLSRKLTNASESKFIYRCTGRVFRNDALLFNLNELVQGKKKEDKSDDTNDDVKLF